jgi:hypothetical protein
MPWPPDDKSLDICTDIYSQLENKSTARTILRVRTERAFRQFHNLLFSPVPVFDELFHAPGHEIINVVPGAPGIIQGQAFQHYIKLIIVYAHIFTR